MLKHHATVRWTNSGPDFLKRRYSRQHQWHFDGGAVIQASPSPHIVPTPWSDPAGVDPEEAFIASVASCHMLWFLHVAIDAGLTVESYEDVAEGEMTKNEHGIYWISRIRLHPRVRGMGGKTLDPGELKRLHRIAHEQCFIAQSIRTHVEVMELEEYKS